MNIIAVDDNHSDLQALKKAIKISAPNSVLSIFTRPDEALRYADLYAVDVAFIESIIGEYSGLSVAKNLMGINRRTSIIFITNEKHYIAEALSIHVSGYALKPVTSELIVHELSKLHSRNPNISDEEEEHFYMIKAKYSEIAIPFSALYCVKYKSCEMLFDIECMETLSIKVPIWRFGKFIAPLLSDKRFLKVNKSCVINMDWIKQITNDSLVLCTGMVINLPRNSYKEINDKINGYYGNSIHLSR